MSPPYDANPDRRPLPAGWITQYDANYNAWFYVNTEAQPPITTWNHPLGPAPPPPPPEGTYSPPAVPPNNNSSTYGGGYSSAIGQGGYPSQGGENGYPQPFGGAEYPQQNDNNQKGLGGLLGRLAGGHRPGHQGLGGGGGYSGQQQVAYVEQKPASKGSGMGMLALAGGAGLLGGVLLGEGIERHEERREERREELFRREEFRFEERRYDDDYSYDAGYDAGFDAGVVDAELDDNGFF